MDKKKLLRPESRRLYYTCTFQASRSESAFQRVPPVEVKGGARLRNCLSRLKQESLLFCLQMKGGRAKIERIKGLEKIYGHSLWLRDGTEPGTTKALAPLNFTFPQKSIRRRLAIRSMDRGQTSSLLLIPSTAVLHSQRK